MSDNALLIDHVDAWHDGRGKQIIHIPILLRRAREGQMMLLPILLHHFRPIFSTDAQGMDIRLVLGLLIEVLYLGKLLLAVRASPLTQDVTIRDMHKSNRKYPLLIFIIAFLFMDVKTSVGHC